MTIAIQGEWGSGKTSLMNMVRELLNAEASRQPKGKVSRQPWIVHQFDTWPYGVAGSDPFLGFRLLESMVQAIKRSIEETRPELFNKVVEISSRIGAVVMRLATGPAARAVAAGVVGSALQGFADGQWTVDAVSGTGSPGPRPATADLGSLRTLFADMVKKLVGCDGDKPSEARVIIFIDDLDRVLPGNAVALLEVLKNFMDVEHCVFVVACDYEVVRLGVKEKLGIEDKAKVDQFFHKIFQAPFHMPVHGYAVDGLLDDFLRRRIKKYQPASETTTHLRRLVTLTIGTNPRAFKRFVNAVELLSCVEAGTMDPTSEGAAPLAGSAANTEGLIAQVTWTKEHYALMALVALQTRWPRLAARLAAAHKESTADANAFLDLIADIPEEWEANLEALESPLTGWFEKDDQFTRGDDRQQIPWHSHPEFALFLNFGRELRQMLAAATGQASTDGWKPLSRWFAALALTGVGGSETRETGWDQFCRALSGTPTLRLASKLRDASWRCLRILSTSNSLSFNVVRSDGQGRSWSSVLSLTTAGSILVSTAGRYGVSDAFGSEVHAAAAELRSATGGMGWKDLDDSDRMKWAWEFPVEEAMLLTGLMNYLGSIDAAWERHIQGGGQKAGQVETAAAGEAPTATVAESSVNADPAARCPAV